MSSTDAAPVATRLLRALKQNPAVWNLPAALADELGAARELLFEAVEQLREQGYVIDFHPYFGFRLVDLPPHFLATEIQDDLNTKHVASRVETFQSVGSVIDAAWELAEQGAPDGAVVLAEEQARGRGRLGQTWTSPRGKGIYCAILCRPQSTPVDAEMLAHATVAGTLALTLTLQDVATLHAEARWPDDVFVGNRKIGHAQVETRNELPDQFVVGISLNTQLTAQDLPEDLRRSATSIRIESGESFNHNRLVRYLLFSFDSLYQNLTRKRYRPVAAGLREYAHLVGREVLIDRAEGEIRGRVASLEPAKISIKDAAGETTTVPAEAVHQLRLVN